MGFLDAGREAYVSSSSAAPSLIPYVVAALFFNGHRKVRTKGG